MSHYHHSKRGNKRPSKRKQVNITESSERSDINEQSSVVQMFIKIQAELDTKHDKYERLVKLSRDVTIESKRIIFLLHRHSSDSDLNVLDDAEKKLRSLERTILKTVATELIGEDPYQFMRAISPGLQEYIEAVSLHHYLINNSLITWSNVCQFLHYNHTDGAGDCNVPLTDKIPRSDDAVKQIQERRSDDAAKQIQDTILESSDADIESKEKTLNKNTEKCQEKIRDRSFTSTEETNKQSVETSHHFVDSRKKDKNEVDSVQAAALSLAIPQHEYILGIADLTGELMRQCIMAVSAGKFTHVTQLCSFIRCIYDGFTCIGNTGPREVGRKYSALKSSLHKVENACYTLEVRGSEIPKQMLGDVFTLDEEKEFEYYDDLG